MIIWINGSFGTGKTTTAEILKKKLTNAHIYDPEQVGYFLWDNFPPEMKQKGDFQDIEIWRSINYAVIQHLYHTFDGYIIIPMTLVNKQYYDEIIGRLKQDGAVLRHFILTASKKNIVERLLRRGEQSHSWAEQQIDRCLTAFQNEIPGIQIDTDSLDAESAEKTILEML